MKEYSKAVMDSLSAFLYGHMNGRDSEIGRSFYIFALEMASRSHQDPKLITVLSLLHEARTIMLQTEPPKIDE